MFETLKPLWETTRSVIPIVGFMLIFQLLVLKKSVADSKQIIGGLVLSILGLHFFLKGISLSLLPLGDSIGRDLFLLDNKYIIVGFAFVLGYFATLVEPALRTLALEVEEVSVGAIPTKTLIHAVAVGFGIGMALGIFKILNNIPTSKIVMPILVLAIVLCRFAPEEYVAIAMDSASATTGPVNIPLNMALAIGLAKISGFTDPLLNGFGIIGLTSLGAVISVLVLGIIGGM
ncbi:MAG TPA: DUF1538 domain-containing protein [Firmicutes bacterium]|nr:DUF1538 domain-containing protein [Bacillota bacterium]